LGILTVIIGGDNAPARFQREFEEIEKILERRERFLEPIKRERF